jgi:hypothetical protein
LTVQVIGVGFILHIGVGLFVSRICLHISGTHVLDEPYKQRKVSMLGQVSFAKTYGGLHAVSQQLFADYDGDQDGHLLPGLPWVEVEAARPLAEAAQLLVEAARPVVEAARPVAEAEPPYGVVLVSPLLLLDHG